MSMQFYRTASTGAYRLRGTFQQAVVRDFLYQVPVRTVYGFGGSTVAGNVTDVFQKGLCTNSFAINNRSGSAGVMGFGYCWDNSVWKAGTWVNATPAFTEATTDAQDPGANDVTLNDEAGAATDGWVILSRRPFSWISVDVGTATVGNETFTVAYSNAAGTGWTNITANQALVSTALFSGSATTYGTGEHIFCWNPPSNWGKIVADQGIAGLTTYVGYYAFRVTVTGVDITTSGLADAIEIGSMVFSQESVADNATVGEDNITYQDYDAIGVVCLQPAATIGTNVDFVTFPCG